MATRARRALHLRSSLVRLGGDLLFEFRQQLALVGLRQLRERKDHLGQCVGLGKQESERDAEFLGDPRRGVHVASGFLLFVTVDPRATHLLAQPDVIAQLALGKAARMASLLQALGKNGKGGKRKRGQFGSLGHGLHEIMATAFTTRQSLRDT